MPVICNLCENAVEDEAEGPPDGQSKLTIAMDLNQSQGGMRICRVW